MPTPKSQNSIHGQNFQRSKLPEASTTQKTLTNIKTNVRGGSLDRRRTPKTLETTVDDGELARTPVLCNRYVMDQNEVVANHVPSKWNIHIDGVNLLSETNRNLGSCRLVTKARNWLIETRNIDFGYVFKENFLSSPNYILCKSRKINKLELNIILV